MLDECDDRVQVPTLSKNINVLDALMWIARAWKRVSVDTVTNCFKKDGFRSGEVNVNQYETVSSQEMEVLQQLLRDSGNENL
jgi:hypothetical protein